MPLDFSDVLTNPDTPAVVIPGTIAAVYANGTADVNIGGNRIVTGCSVLTSYTPIIGDPVELIARESSTYLVLGSVRLGNAATITVNRSWRIPYNVNPALGGGSSPTTVSVTATESWRSKDGWYTDVVRQGAFSALDTYDRGCYFYGASAFTALAGRTCTRLRIRLTVGGFANNPVDMWLAPHIHPVQPASAPYFTDSPVKAGSMAINTVATFDLPVAWGQGLIDGTYAGFGHVVDSVLGWANLFSKTSDAATGQLTIDWV